MREELTFGGLTVRVGGTPPVYDPGGATWIALGPSGGRRLLEALDGDVTVVCACHDEPKRGLMHELGFESAYTWFQKSLA